MRSRPHFGPAFFLALTFAFVAVPGPGGQVHVLQNLVDHSFAVDPAVHQALFPLPLLLLHGPVEPGVGAALAQVPSSKHIDEKVIIIIHVIQTVDRQIENKSIY